MLMGGGIGLGLSTQVRVVENIVPRTPKFRLSVANKIKVLCLQTKWLFVLDCPSNWGQKVSGATLGRAAFY